jgi:hypothetical protein
MATPPFPNGVDRAYIVFRCAFIDGRLEYAHLKVSLLFSHLASMKAKGMSCDVCPKSFESEFLVSICYNFQYGSNT